MGVLFRFYKAGGKAARRERRASSQFQTKRLTAALTGSITGSFLSTLNICAFVVFFTVVIRMLFLSGLLSLVAGWLGMLLAPLGLNALWASQLLTGLVELTSGVWSLSGGGALTGRMSMAAFMLGWAGISVHCQVLSFLGDSGLSPKTYLMGKLLHGALAALLTAGLCALIPLDASVSYYIAQQVEGIAGMDFESALVLSTVSAWVMGLLFLLLAAMAVRNKGRKLKRSVV
ncbi:hypothetical protein SDC9_125925 [bioreactor metagenome]|uniref:Sporulation integral membrane protein YlbJ n=1 Tax=bioreactor metagenome TaxID=1076179 RepID=A0A645CP98_9ZZZZ